eukprot:m51a1_g6339 hypothetical protein (816) ;mRNA; f:29128-32811
MSWTSGLCGCCDDTSSCLCAWLVPCYQHGRNVEAFGAGPCCSNTSACSHCMCFVLLEAVGNCGFCAVALHRQMVRRKYGIEGGVCGDVCVSCMCPCCALSQIAREIQTREALVRYNGRRGRSPGYVQRPPLQGPSPAETLRVDLRRSLARLGDKPTPPATAQPIETDITKLADSLCESLSAEREYIISNLVECGAMLATKVPYYGALAGVMCTKSDGLAGDVVAKVHEQLSAALGASNWTRAKLLLRFAVELSNSRVLTLSSVAQLLNTLVEAAAALKDSSRGRADRYAHIALMSAPWISDAAAAHALVSSLAPYISSRSPSALDAAYLPWPTAVPEAHDPLRALHSDLSASLDTPYAQRTSSLLEGTLSQLSPVDFPAVALSADPDASDASAPLTRPMLRFYEAPEEGSADAGGGAGELYAVDRWVVEDMACDVIDIFRDSAQLCAQQLLQLQVRGPLRRVLVEVVFSCLLELPRAPAGPVHWAALLVALGRIDREFIPESIRAANALYRRELATMDVECADRFNDWFVMFVRNFNYEWSWSHWAAQAQQSPRHAQFIRDAVDRILRVSQWEKLSKDADLAPYLPAAKPELCPAIEGDDSLAETTRDFAAMLETTEPAAAREWLEARADEGKISERQVLDVLTTALLSRGTILSRLWRLILKFRPLLVTFAASAEQKSALLACALAYCHSASVRFHEAVDRLLEARVLSGPEVLAFLLGEANADALVRADAWELVRDVLGRYKDQELAPLAQAAFVGLVDLLSSAPEEKKSGLWHDTVSGRLLEIMRCYKGILSFAEYADKISALGAPFTSFLA